MLTYFFLFNARRADTLKTLESLKAQRGLDRIVVLQPRQLPDSERLDDMQDSLVSTAEVEDYFFTGAVISKIYGYKADCFFLYTKTTPLKMGYRAVERMLQVCCTMDQLVYADHYEVKDGQTQPHPLIDYQQGSVRNDFDFGSVMLFNTWQPDVSKYKHAALYRALLDVRHKTHLREMLYTEEESDLRKSGDKQFDYVNPAQREVQIEMEEAFTEWLEQEALLLSDEMIRDVDLGEKNNAQCPMVNGQCIEASVIIPVRNREKTIADAIRSVLSQEADFKYNVIVVDNHSTDGTSAAIEAIAREDNRVVHIVPQQDDLGIGGCWDLAVRSEQCGKFAVQLDSDDLYSGPDTLQKIVDKFYETKAAMVIGSYSLVDFNLQPLPPGLIDHREWTDHNGMNNALRINGLGAPRAFYTPVIREIGFPNTSYGEDYAVGLAISRKYKIGRIYDCLYLCRRWDGNSDAALSIDKVNRNNAYKDSLRSMEMNKRINIVYSGSDITPDTQLDEWLKLQHDSWPEVKQRFAELDTKVEKHNIITAEGLTLTVQYNPARIRSTAAMVDKQSIARRRCFLCIENQPKEQMHVNFESRYQLCINPYPILHRHCTIPLIAHKPQLMAGHYGDLKKLIQWLPKQVVFYNGPQCGASAPDHFHFQTGDKDEMPLLRDIQKYKQTAEKLADGILLIKDYACPVLYCEGIEDLQMMVDMLPMVEGESEPRFNILAWYDEIPREETNGQWLMVNGQYQENYLLIPRGKLRPDCYFAEGEQGYCISPGAVDMSGLIITPREEDYRRLTGEQAAAILKEVALEETKLNEVCKKIKAHGSCSNLCY